MMIVLFMPVLSSADIIISEYVEGSSYNKAVELYNTSENAIDLSSDDFAEGIRRTRELLDEPRTGR